LELDSRNGQDVVSGIYLFTVESKPGTQRGRFVIIAKVAMLEGGLKT